MTVIIGQHLEVAKRISKAFYVGCEKTYVRALEQALNGLPIQTADKVTEIKNIFADMLIFMCVAMIANTVGTIEPQLEENIIQGVRQKFNILREEQTRAQIAQLPENQRGH